MRMFRSFLLRMVLILSLNATIGFGLMAATMAMQDFQQGLVFTSLLTGLLFLWLVINWWMVRKVDPEISLETARFLYPAAILLNPLLSWNLAIYMQSLLPIEGLQHVIQYFVGFGISVFLIIRLFDIKWLRPEEEVSLYEDQTG